MDFTGVTEQTDSSDSMTQSVDFTGVTEQTDSSDSMTQSVGFHRGSRTNSRVGLGLNNYSPTDLNWGGGGGGLREASRVGD